MNLENKMRGEYEDIIDLDYEAIKSKNRPRMLREKRAAQFMPFSPLRGLKDAIQKVQEEMSEKLEGTKYIFCEES